MTKYIALVDFADGAYGVSFPDIPGCTAMAGSLDEAINDAADALAEWVIDERADGREVPEPSGVHDLLGTAEVKEALGRGAVFASVPLILESGRLARANISLDAGLLVSIDMAASELGVTRSAFLAAAARDKIKAIA